MKCEKANAEYPALRAPVIRVLAALCVGVFLFSCSKQSSGDKLVVISPHPETLLYEYEWAFQPWYREKTGRDIDVIYIDQGGTSRMLRYVYSEFERSPESAGIDMVWGGGIENYIELAGKGLLHAYRLPDAIIDAVPADYFGLPLYDKRFRWYATSMTGFGIVFNRRVLELQNLAKPESWTDLTDPEYYSWVGSADPRQSGSAHMVFETILQEYGWKKGWETITAMAANVKTFSRLSSDPPKNVALGEVACALCIDSYAYAQMAFTGHDVMGYVMSSVNPEGIGILNGAPNLQAAEAYLEFVMSKEGQRFMMTEVGRRGGPREFRIARMSVQPSVYDELGTASLVRVNPFHLKSAVILDSAKSSARWRLLNDLFGRSVVENHDLLRQAWEAIQAAEPGRRAGLVERLGRMPITEMEAMRLASEVWGDHVASNKLMLEWSQFAREKYGAVRREARESR